MKYSLLALILSVAILLNAQTPAQQPQSKGQNSSQGSGNSGGSSSKAASGSTSDQKLEKYAKVKWRKKLKIARNEIAAGSYISAAEYLEDVYKDKPDKVEVMHLLGNVNRLLRDYEAAEKYYKLSLQKSPDAFIDDSYYLGVMQKINGKYDDAKKTLTDYLKAKLDKGDKSYKNQAKLDIEGIDSAQIILKNPSKIKVEKTTGINAILQDLSPQPLKGNRILFAQQKNGYCHR
jgi:tetratricopeptide (TPR) repeat protein